MSNEPYNLIKAVEKQEAMLAAFGFPWESLAQILDQARSECKEIDQAWQTGDRDHLEEEIGDLLQAAIGVAVFCGIDTETAMAKSIQKFQRRFERIVELARADGFDTLHGQPPDVLMSYWNRAKVD